MSRQSANSAGAKLMSVVRPFSSAAKSSILAGRARLAFIQSRRGKLCSDSGTSLGAGADAADGSPVGADAADGSPVGADAADGPPVGADAADGSPLGTDATYGAAVGSPVGADAGATCGPASA